MNASPLSPATVWTRITTMGIASIMAITGLFAGVLLTGTVNMAPPSTAAVSQPSRNLGTSPSVHLESGFAGIVKTVRPAIVPRQPHGVVVEAVQPNSQPDRAGLRRGDVISEINRQPVRSLQAYQRMVSHLRHEQPALFLVNRGGASLFLTVRV